MKTLSRHILESLEIDIFWLLDKWFERNENQKQEFMNIVAYCLNDKIPQTPEIKEYIKGTSLENDLKEFVNFIIWQVHMLIILEVLITRISILMMICI